MTVKRIILIIGIIGVIAQIRPWSSVKSQTGDEKPFKNLHQLMEEGIHERFTFLSYTLWHDQPMTPEKMDAIAQSANQLRQLAEAIPSFRPRSLQGESMKDDQKAFDAVAAELSNSAMMLAEAATVKDRTRTENLFDRLEASCRSCHTKFNSALGDK